MKSLTDRLNPKFKLSAATSAHGIVLQLSGPIETQVELDAVVGTLTLMRDWFASSPGGSHEH